MPFLKPPEPDPFSSLSDLTARSALPSSGSPAYRALLVAFARPDTPPDTAVTSPPPPKLGSAAAAAPAPDVALGFLYRQMALLRNAVREGSAAPARLEAQVERLLLLRAAPLSQSGSAATVETEETSLRATLGEFGVGGGGGAVAELAICWPAEVGFRLYCELLEATFEADEPAELAEDKAEIEALLRCTWTSLRIDPARHDLATLSVYFDHYQHSGAPLLLAAVDVALTAVLRTAAPAPSGEGDDWLWLSAHTSEVRFQGFLHALHLHSCDTHRFAR